MAIDLCQQIEWSFVVSADFLMITKEASSCHCTVDATVPRRQPGRCFKASFVTY